MKTVIRLHEKQDLRSKVNTLREATLKHCKRIKSEGCTQGIFLSRSPNGTLTSDFWGCTDEDKLAMLESAKYLVLRDMWS